MKANRVQCVVGRHEQGEYFSLDLGGSNLRVMFVKLSREHGQVVSPMAILRTPAAALPCPIEDLVLHNMQPRREITMVSAAR